MCLGCWTKQGRARLQERLTKDARVGWGSEKTCGLCTPDVKMAFGKGFSSAKAWCLPVSVLESVFSVSLLWSEWMCSPKLIYWNPNHPGGDIRRWLGHEGGVLMHGISALTKESPQDPLPLLPGEDTERIWPSVKQEVSPHQRASLPAPWS